MPVQPYLFFEGRTEEALDFYRSALGAETEMLMRYRESPEMPPEDCRPKSMDLVMHASFRVGDTVLMASDGMGSGKPNFAGFSLSYTARDAADADRAFAALSDGGQVQMPLGATFFSPRFGMVADKFGLSWMVIVE